MTYLRETREKCNKTQTFVAQKAGITARAYQQYEYGKRTPNVNIAMCIAKALNTTVENLWGK